MCNLLSLTAKRESIVRGRVAVFLRRILGRVAECRSRAEATTASAERKPSVPRLTWRREIPRAFRHPLEKTRGMSRRGNFSRPSKWVNEALRSFRATIASPSSVRAVCSLALDLCHNKPRGNKKDDYLAVFLALSTRAAASRRAELARLRRLEKMT